MNSKIRDIEFEFLKGNTFDRLSDDEKNILKKVVFCADENEEILNSNYILSKDFLYYLVNNLTNFSDSPKLENKLSNLKTSITCTIKSKSSYNFEFNILLLSICALQKFVEKNWTGPQNETQFNFLLEFFNVIGNNKKDILYLLCTDSESIYENTRNPELLLLSDTLLSALSDSNCISAIWWRLRNLMIHQYILLEKSMTIYKDTKYLSSILLEQDWIKDNNCLAVQLYVELGLSHLYYHEVSKAKDMISFAQNLTGLEVELTGAFGKRTQYQQKPVAQLLIKIKKRAIFKNLSVPELESCDLPHDLLIQDDVILNKTEFLSDSDNIICDLIPEEQLILLAQCCLIQKSEVADEIRNEKVMAYIDCLLSQKKIWCVHFKCLFMRCKLDKVRTRKIERAMAQLEHLLSLLKANKPEVFLRQNLFYSTFFPPFWILQQELGDLLFSLGAVKSALEVYQELGWWEGIVKCYYVLNRHEEIATIVREKLLIKETPNLLCLLGDITNDIDCYTKAWELSNFKSARSQAGLGNYYYKKQDYKNCISYFEKSLELNHLQPNLWFSLGFAATQIGNYDLAASAYRHVTVLDSDNFEAWNNLSNAYIKSQQKERAFYTLQEAIKCNYEDWHIWENYLLVTLDVGAFEEAIHACHRILDLKKRFEDTEVLRIIATAISTNVTDITKQDAFRLKKKALQLFGRVTSIVINNGDIWKSYALLHMSDSTYLSNVESLELIIKYLHKSLTYTLQKSHALKDVPSCKSILLTACDLANSYEAYCKLVERQIKLQTQAQANLMLKNILIRIEKQIRDFNAESIHELKELLDSLSLSHTRIQEC